MKKILVVAHDAGAAQLYASYFFYKKIKFDAILTGPAKKVFDLYNFQFINFNKLKLKKIITNYDFIFTSSGWQTNLEKNAFLLANRNNIKIISFIDHWSNYKKRFLFKNKKILPYQIWVNNNKALNLLKKEKNFFGNKIKLITNYFKKYVKNKYKNIKIRYKKSKITKILFICEPFIKKIDGFSNQEIISSLIYFINTKIKKKIILNIRLHPSQKPKDVFFLKKINYKNIKIIISKEDDLILDLARNNLIVGCNSFALVVSLWLNKRTYYFFTDLKKKSFLTNIKIKNFRNLKNI